ncbi:MAG: CARDB domain-containing protein, partial [Candidatus Poribacteria bacterium]
ETNVPLPSNSSSELYSESSIGVVQAYVWNDAIDGVGYKTYTIGGPNITNIRTKPEVIPPDEPIYILSEVRSSSRVKSVVFYYRTSPGKDWAQIEMERLSGDTFKTASTVPGHPAGTFIYYYIEAVDAFGRETKTSSKTLRIARNPDLFISEKNIRWTVGVPSLLSAEVKNTGQLEAKNVIVQFFNGPPENGNQIGTDKIIPSLKSSETATVQLKWQPEENRQTVFVVVDPKSSPDDEYGKIIESNEFNNIASKEFFRDKFVLTPAQGSNGVISSVDGNLFFQLPQGAIAEDAILTIEKRDNVEISEQPDLRYAPIGSRKSEEGTSYRLTITPITSHQSPITKFDARLMIKSAGDSSVSDVNQLGIYLRDEETDKWLYVGSEQMGDRIAASISEPGLYALLENNDHTPPQIEITVEHQSFIEGSYISETPIISAQITDENGVDTRANRLMMFLDDTTIDASEYTYSVSPTKSNLVLLSYAPTLSPGTHNISVLAFDASNLSAQESISGEVAGELEIKNVANYPNPFEPGAKEKNKGTIFAYILTTQADKLILKIYTATGKLVKAMDDLDAFADYNEYHWNGLDEDDEELANGVYFYKLIAEKENKRVNKIGKLAILR